jgi:type III pantothenate kinase
MKKKFLAIDIGNTHITSGVFDGDELLGEFRLASRVERTSDEYGLLIYCFLEQNNVKSEDISGCGISSVVDNLTPIVYLAIEKHVGIEPKIIHSGLKFNFINKYIEPKKLGVDRICAVQAAINKYGKPVIVADFGTATTIEIVNKEGEYLGGIIMPGLETMATSLFENTAKLPIVDKNFPENIIGRTTLECIKSGVMYGSLLAFEGFICRIWDQLGYRTNIVVTGGLSSVLLGETQLPAQYEKNLVLEGIKSVYLDSIN